MAVPIEVDDLERLISSLTQEIWKKKAGLKTLEEKIVTATTNRDRCREFKLYCEEHLQKMKKAKWVVLDDYRKMLKLYQDNHDFVIKYQNELVTKAHEKRVTEEALPVLETMLQEARDKLARWGVVIKLRP